MKIVAIIQARMSSARLPGKVMLKLGDKIVLEHVTSRVKLAKSINQVVVATSTDASDDVISQWCEENQVDCYRGSLTDVLDRYVQAATHFNADYVVRITADCPLIDPHIIDEVVRFGVDGEYDAYALAGAFPDGLDCQIFNFKALAVAHLRAVTPTEREHVGVFIEESRPDLFKIGFYHKFEGLSDHRWTLDEPADYQFLEEVFKYLAGTANFIDTKTVLALLNEKPFLKKINGDFRQIRV